MNLLIDLSKTHSVLFAFIHLHQSDQFIVTCNWFLINYCLNLNQDLSSCNNYQFTHQYSNRKIHQDCYHKTVIHWLSDIIIIGDLLYLLFQIYLRSYTKGSDFYQAVIRIVYILKPCINYKILCPQMEMLNNKWYINELIVCSVRLDIEDIHKLISYFFLYLSYSFLI